MGLLFGKAGSRGGRVSDNMTAPMDPTNPESRVPERIGRYVDLHILGRGGMGIVYRGYDPELDRPVAIKVMLHSTPDFVARFRREAQSIARLTHGNVVQVYDFGVDEEGNPYFVMELVEGTPLDVLLAQRGRLTPTEAIGIARHAALGLGAAHRAGIIHRDVKPSNLIVDARGGVKLVDFGIARAQAGAQLTNAAALMGTPGYMAPEQAQGRTVDHRADIYALGLTLFEMLDGAPPFAADDPIALVVMNMQEPLPDLRTRGLGLPEDLVELVEQMGRKDPAQRVQSSDAVVRALDAIGAGESPTPPLGFSAPVQQVVGTSSVPPTNIRALEPTDGRRRLSLAIGVALAVAGVGVAGVLTLGPSGSHGQQVARPAATSDAPKVVLAAKAPKVDPVPAAVVPTAATGPLKVGILKFQNIGKDAALGQLELGIGATAIDSIGRAAAGRMMLMERSDLDSDIGEIDRGKDEHFDKASVARMGELKGLDVAVQGGFQRAGKIVRVTVRFIRVETGEILDTLRVDKPVRTNDSGVLELQDQVGNEVRGHLLALVDRERPATPDPKRSLTP